MHACWTPDVVRENAGVHSVTRGGLHAVDRRHPASEKEFAAEMVTVHGVLPIDATHACKPGISVRCVSRETGDRSYGGGSPLLPRTRISMAGMTNGGGVVMAVKAAVPGGSAL